MTLTLTITRRITASRYLPCTYTE